MTLLYKPVAVLLAFFAGRVAVSMFETLWSWIDEDDAPDAKSVEAPMSKILLAAALQGAVMKGTQAAISRGGAKSWERAFGVDPLARPTEHEAALS